MMAFSAHVGGACGRDARTEFMATIYVLMGPQGAGKGTQAQLLADRFGLPIVATGDMLREIAKTDTPLGHHVKAVLARGELVSDDILAEVVKERLCNNDCRGGSILDGFPRTLPQARLLEKADKEEVIRQRLQLYMEKTRPLLEYYDETNRLYRVDGTGTPENVFSRIAEIVAKESNGGSECRSMSEV